ncbi:MAG: hypothetical protein NC345_13435 [Lachnospira sp.]|nr:hypothetical protein [Lachnospira sp.]
MLHIDLSELAGGELQAKFDREITKVIENMKDPNTPYQEARSVTIKISLKQTELRDDAKVDISVNSKLAGVISAKTNFAMGKDLKTGEVLIQEYGKQIPGQMAFSDIAPAGPEVESQTDGKKTIPMPRVLKANG